MSDYDNSFITMPARIGDELERRIASGRRCLQFHNAFLDDYMRGILPSDLVLIGAPSGMGKTDLAMNIATTNAMTGKRVAYFALEAEPLELERRTKFALLTARAHAAKKPNVDDLNFPDWMLGRCEHIVGEWNREVDQQMLEHLSGLWTYYRSTKFDADDLVDKFLHIQKFVDMVIIDHLHYIDGKADETETEGLSGAMKAIRDTALFTGKPVILIAHLRKRNRFSKQLVAEMDDFHGSSNIVKIATRALTLERANGIEAAKWYWSPTFMTVLKDRHQGPCPFVALMNFDRRTRSYAPKYELGKLTNGGTEWEPLGQHESVRWAKHREWVDRGVAL